MDTQSEHGFSTIKVLPRDKKHGRYSQLLVDDTVYELSPEYREGAKAMRDEVPWSCNPYREGSQRADAWNYGHENESAGIHEGLPKYRGRDVI